MMTLFDQEKAVEDYGRVKMREGEKKGIEQGLEQGLEQGVEKGIRAMVSAFKEAAFAPAAVAQTLMKQFGLSQDVAEQKVQQYWS